MIKKLLTLAMALTMALSIASVTAFAVESTNKENISLLNIYDRPVDFPNH